MSLVVFREHFFAFDCDSQPVSKHTGLSHFCFMVSWSRLRCVIPSEWALRRSLCFDWSADSLTLIDFSDLDVEKKKGW
jgi:hypothetical protein